jgi:hypothetical protein
LWIDAQRASNETNPESNGRENAQDARKKNQGFCAFCAFLPLFGLCPVLLTVVYA